AAVEEQHEPSGRAARLVSRSQQPAWQLQLLLDRERRDTISEGPRLRIGDLARLDRVEVAVVVAPRGGRHQQRDLRGPLVAVGVDGRARQPSQQRLREPADTYEEGSLQAFGNRE